MATGHGEKRTRKERLFMQALLSSATIEDAAAIAGISPTTAYRWHAEASFKAEFRALQTELVEGSLVQLKMSMSEALAVLRSVMNNGGNPPAARVTAARAVLDNAFKAVETSDILERLEALEAQAGRGSNASG
jgi:transposase-like protein